MALKLASAYDDPARAASSPVRWLYLGRDYRLMQRWETALGPSSKRVDYAAELQALAMSWRAPYLEWLSELGRMNNALAWWCSRIAERNTTLYSLFHSLCYLHIGLARLVAENPPELVVAEDAGVLEAIGRARNANWRRAALRDIRRWLARLIPVWSRYAADAIAALRDSHVTGRRAAPAPAGRPVVLLHECIDEAYFGPDGQPRSRYFPGLAPALEQMGYEVVTLPWLFQLGRTRRQAFAWFRKHAGKYLVPEDFYTLPDYLWAAAIVFWQARLPRGASRFNDLDITPLVKSARRRHLLDPAPATFARYYRLIGKLAARGWQPSAFIDTFENMLSEKPQVIAFRRYMPETLTVGFQHYCALPPLHLCLFTTAQEATFAPHPDVIVCNSPLTHQQLVEAGFPAAKLRIGASLRYPHLGRPLGPRSPEPNTIMAILSLDPDATAELLAMVLAAFPAADNAPRIWLKKHPMMSEETLPGLLPKAALPRHISFVDGELESWLGRAACAVAICTTSALEVALMAVPLILVGRQTDFDINPLAQLAGAEAPVHSAQELWQAVHAKLHASADDLLQLRAWAEHVRKQGYAPPSDEAFRNFVQALPPGSRCAGTAIRQA